MFTKEERNTFPYYFAHLFAFNMVALNCHAWKFKYLFHDFEKPWLKLFMPYKKVQKWHREHSRHHLEWADTHGRRFDRLDWDAMMIDWECAGLTKSSSPLNAAQELHKEFHELFQEDIEKAMALKAYGSKALARLGLERSDEMADTILGELDEMLE